MSVTLGDTLNLIGMLVVILGIAQILRALGMIRSTIRMLIAASGLRESGLNQFTFDLDPQGPGNGGAA